MPTQNPQGLERSFLAAGAVTQGDGTVKIYRGGADTVICVGTR